jgi:hypothetical protein
MTSTAAVFSRAMDMERERGKRERTERGRETRGRGE